MGRAAGAAVGEPGQHGAVGPDRRYRPDVDGLRALAVAPILLGHAGVPGFGGGFLGVDLFFVISGYLITSILARDLGEGRFSLIGFYRRRAVRILPALLTMLAAVLLAGHLLMFPAESKELGKSAGAAAGFIANLYFYSSIGYFSPAAELRPLLHTWSLGAEEQFYLLYPLLLAGAYRVFGRRLVPAVMVLTLASLAFSAAAAWRWPEDAFYLLPSRGWELGLGGLAALGVLPALGRAVQNGAALAGAALVAMGLVFASWGLAVPVPAALLPCAGCMLLLTYGEGAATSRLFAAHPARALGLISYSLYLWHWPLMAFYRLETGLRLEPIEMAGLVLASLAAATVSYWLVEQPFRRRFRSAPPLKALAAAAAAILLVGAVAAATVLRPGSWRSSGLREARMAAYWDYDERPDFTFQFRLGSCFRGSPNDLPFDPAVCLPLDPSRPNVAVVGDSHAAQYWRALALRYRQVNVIQGTGAGCTPSPDSTGREGCVEMMRYVFGPLLRSGRLDTVVLAGRWQEDQLPRLAATVAEIRRHGTQVVILGPTVEYQGIFPALLARAMAHGDPELVRVHRDGERERLDRRMESFARRVGARYVSVIRVLCRGRTCQLAAPDGAPMQFDYGHLTYSGSRWVVDRMPLQLP